MIPPSTATMASRAKRRLRVKVNMWIPLGCLGDRVGRVDRLDVAERADDLTSRPVRAVVLDLEYRVEDADDERAVRAADRYPRLTGGNGVVASAGRDDGDAGRWR